MPRKGVLLAVVVIGILVAGEGGSLPLVGLALLVAVIALILVVS